MRELSYNHLVEGQDVDYTVKVNDDDYVDLGIVWRDFWREICQECLYTAASSEAHSVVLHCVEVCLRFLARTFYYIHWDEDRKRLASHRLGSGLQHHPLQACPRSRKKRKVWQSLRKRKAIKFHCFFRCMVVLSLLSGADSSFIEVPKNTVVVKGESPETIVIACKSDCQCNLLWFVQKNSGSEKETLYNGYFLRPDADSYCTVLADEPGECYLNLTNTEEVAQTYICLEPISSHEASAELIWLDVPSCNDYSTKDFVNLTCSIEFRGNWAPTMEWKEHSGLGEKVLPAGVNTCIVPNQLVTSTLVMDVQDGSRNYTCTTKFDIIGKSPRTTAINIPEYTYSKVVRQQDKPERKEISYNLLLGLFALCFVLLGLILLIFIMHQKCYSLKRKQPLQTCHEQDKDAVPLKKIPVNQKSTVWIDM